MTESRIQELLVGRTDMLDPVKVIQAHPWLAERELNCILSPDSDGLLCGLFMSHYLDWKIKGFYDGKLLVVEQGTRVADCVFLDMEIFRNPIRSVGQHMLLYNRNRLPPNWSNFDNCLSPNNMRNYDGLHDFRLKYPFGTIHILIAALWLNLDIQIPDSGITPLLFTDGTWMNLLKYTENSLNWITYLRADDARNPLHRVFMNDHFPVHALMVEMDKFLRSRDKLSVPRERGDRIAITLRGGDQQPHNLESIGGVSRFRPEPKARGESFIKLLSDLTLWEYKPDLWTWSDWLVYQFKKVSLSGGTSKLNGTSYDLVMTSEPLSLAITSGAALEYTIGNLPM